MRTLLLLLILTCSFATAFGQGMPMVNLYPYDPSWINPAFVGSQYNHKFSFYGNTYLSSDFSGLTTSSVSYEVRLPVISSGAGLRLINDRIGPLFRTQLSGLYSYQHELSTSSVRVGTNIMYSREVLDFSFFQCIDCDPLIINGNPEDEGWDADVGVAYQVEDVTVGVTLLNMLNSKTESLDGDNTRAFNAYIAYKAKLSEHISFHPSVLYLKRSQYSRVDINAYFSIYDALLGVSYEPGDDFFHEWRFHGGINVSNVVECLALYVPKGGYTPSRGELLVRVTLGEKKE